MMIKVSLVSGSGCSFGGVESFLKRSGDLATRPTAAGVAFIARPRYTCALLVRYIGMWNETVVSACLRNLLLARDSKECATPLNCRCVAVLGFSFAGSIYCDGMPISSFFLNLLEIIGQIYM